MEIIVSQAEKCPMDILGRVGMAERRTKSEGFMLRFPDGMRDRLKSAAEASNRSMNAEIVDRLEVSFAEWPRIRMPPDLHGRVMSGSLEQRDKAEREISSYACKVAETAFPPPDREIDLMMESFSNLIDSSSRLSEDARAELWAQFHALMEKVYIETLQSQ